MPVALTTRCPSGRALPGYAFPGGSERVVGGGGDLQRHARRAEGARAAGAGIGAGASVEELAAMCRPLGGGSAGDRPESGRGMRCSSSRFGPLPGVAVEATSTTAEPGGSVVSSPSSQAMSPSRAAVSGRWHAGTRHDAVDERQPPHDRRVRREGEDRDPRAGARRSSAPCVRCACSRRWPTTSCSVAATAAAA